MGGLGGLQAAEQLVPLSPVHLRGFLGCPLLVSSLLSLGQGHAHPNVVSLPVGLLGLLKTHTATEITKTGVFFGRAGGNVCEKSHFQMNLLWQLTGFDSYKNIIAYFNIS